jgi:probable HAF family extracellular repeat protein
MRFATVRGLGPERKESQMKRLTRPAFWVPLLSALPVVSLLVLGAAPAEATFAAGAAPRFVAVDLGTLGGPNSVPNDPGRSITEDGIVVGGADTAALDPFPNDPGCVSSPCHADHAFEWRNGHMTDLGALHGYQSGLFELNGSGVGVGVSETGKLDPLTGIPETHAVLSKNGQLMDLGTLGGHQSWATSINDRGQVAGLAANKTRDLYAHVFSPYPSATQVRATLWQGGKPHNLGTLGGPDSLSGLVNQQGQVAGESFTNFKKNPVTRLPTMDPFVWQHGVMNDLGTLGGKFGFATWMNNHGQAVGASDQRGDQTFHPFLWNGHRLVDLGTLGGHNGIANWINDTGTVAGFADVPGSQTQHGFLWANGHIRNLPPTGTAQCSIAWVVNTGGQAVGADTDCQGNNLAAVLWEHSAAYDLNTLIGRFPVHLAEAFYISNQGEIACLGTLPNGNLRVVLLVPAALAARQGLSATPATSQPPAPQRAAARGVPDPRDDLTSLLGQLTARTRPGLQP